MSTQRALDAIDIAAQFIAPKEGIATHAYPDPRSPMARKMTPAQRERCMRTGEIPAAVKGLRGDPWSIGVGATGPDIRPGVVWTRQQAIDRFEADLVRFQIKARRTWPGIERLPARAEAAFISLAFNRGTDLTDRGRQRDPIDRRREMRALVPAVAAQDLVQIEQLFRDMRRVWVGEGMGGLIARRMGEADLIRAARENGL